MFPLGCVWHWSVMQEGKYTSVAVRGIFTARLQYRKGVVCQEQDAVASVAAGLHASRHCHVAGIAVSSHATQPACRRSIDRAPARMRTTHACMPARHQSTACFPSLPGRLLLAPSAPARTHLSAHPSCVCPGSFQSSRGSLGNRRMNTHLRVCVVSGPGRAISRGAPPRQR